MPRSSKKSSPPSSPAPSSQDQELAYLKAKVGRTIMLLDVSAQPVEVKTAWLTLLPHMTLAQVDRLIALLEQEFAMTLKAAKEQPEDEELILKLKAAKERYDSQIAAANQKALTALQKIEAQLPT